MQNNVTCVKIAIFETASLGPNLKHCRNLAKLKKKNYYRTRCIKFINIIKFMGIIEINVIEIDELYLNNVVNNLKNNIA